MAVDPPFGASNAYIEMAFMHVWARDRLQAAGAVRMSRVILEVHAAIMVNAKQAIDGSAFDLSAACNIISKLNHVICHYHQPGGGLRI